jgi:hypothetical protein
MDKHSNQGLSKSNKNQREAGGARAEKASRRSEKTDSDSTEKYKGLASTMATDVHKV